MKRTILHPRTLAEAESLVAEFLADRHRKHGDLVMVDDGAGEGAPSGGGDGGQGGSGPGGGQGAGDGGPKNATDDDGNDLGFPVDTPVKDMPDAQQAAYWRHQTKKAQSRTPGNLQELQAKAAELDEIKRSQMTASEKQLADARDAGRAEALQQSNAEQVSNLLHVALSAKGKTGEDLDDLVAAANPAAFIVDGKVSAAKITAYATRIAGSGSGSGGSVDMGQGRREGAPKASVTAGRSLFEERHPKKATATS